MRLFENSIVVRWLRKQLGDGSFLDSVIAWVLAAVAAFIGLVYSVNWKFGVAFAGFITLLAANIYSLQLAILSVFFAIPFDRLGKLGPESILTWAKVLIAVLILAWSARVLAEKEPRSLDLLFHSPLFLLAVVLQVFSLFSVINARDYDIFLAQSVRRLNNFMLFILITTIVNSQKVIRRAFLAFLFAYFFVGLTVMYEIYSGESILSTVWGEADVALDYTLNTGQFRVGGPGGDPDFLAVSVLFPSLVAMSLMLERISRLIKAGVLVVLLLIQISLLATGSRGGLGALLIGAGVFWLFSRMRYKFLIGTAAATVLVTTALLLSLAGAASTERYTGESGGKSLIYRMGWTKMALLMIEDHPLVGVGTGNFVTQYNRYSRTVPYVPRSPYWTHNSFLQTWAENGIVAFIAYAMLFVTAAGAMLRVILTTPDPGLRRLAVLLLSSVCALFFFAGTSNVLENENYWIVFSLVTVTSALAREAVREREGASGAPVLA
jgi:putative inorganic carbon (HCO3(-)) transporter